MTATTQPAETTDSATNKTNAGAPEPALNEVKGLASETWVPIRPVPLCTHIKANAVACGSPAIKGTALCFHHSAVKTALGRVKPLDQVPYGIFSPIPFVFAEDAASLQINFHLLLQAVTEKRVEQRTGTLLLRILHSMAANLKNSLVAEAPCTHGHGDMINPRAEETAPSPAAAQNRASNIEKNEEGPEREKTAPTAAPAPASTSQKRVHPHDDPALKAAVEALPPGPRENVNIIVARRGGLEDQELQYFFLPPYDKEENRPEPWQPDPLHPSVQRVLALCSERP